VIWSSVPNFLVGIDSGISYMYLMILKVIVVWNIVDWCDVWSRHSIFEKRDTRVEIV